MYPQLGPEQRGQQNPPGQRCRVNCSAHCGSSPNNDRNCFTVNILLARFAITKYYRLFFT
jgi:hypothetical protein